jgi:transposase
MALYPASVRERAMKVEEVILRALNKQITFWQAAHIAGVSPRHLRRLYERYRRLGFDGLCDRRKGQPSGKRVPWPVVEQVLGLYREKYFDFSVRHFHEKLRAEHGVTYSYTCIKRLLQGAGLVIRARKRGPHRRKRERRPMAGMLLHIDASSHRWLGGQQWHDLLVVLDDATSEIYYAQLVEQESTATALAALREVVEQHGIFCALYSDRGSHFWLTPKEGEIVDRQRLTQVGRAMRDLGIAMIPAYSPQARGRSERNFGTWQGRLPQELRLRGITTVPEANRFLREHYIAELNRKFSIPAAHPESAFVPATGNSLERIFSLQHEARGQPGRHGAHRQPYAANRKEPMAQHAGQMSRAGLRTLGWHVECVLRAAPGRPLCRRRLALSPGRIEFPGERESRTPPRNSRSPPPYRRKKATVLQPDRSCANRTGHLDVLTISP